MNNLERIIAEARKKLVCPVCGRSYDASEIRLRGFLDKAFIIQTVCSNGHMPLVTVFVATSHPGTTPVVKQQTPLVGRAKVTINDVIESHNILEHFHGDVSELWRNKNSKAGQ